MVDEAAEDRLSVLRKTFALFRRIVAYGRATPAGRQVVYDRLALAMDTLAQSCSEGPTRAAIAGALARLQPTMTVEMIDATLESIEQGWREEQQAACPPRDRHL